MIMANNDTEDRAVILTDIESAPVRKDPQHPLFPEGKTTIHQMLGVDPDTGMCVEHTVYEAGVCPPKHRHSCGHGMYVLSGTLKTDSGLFGPGSFLWWPAGIWMVHGATDTEDVEVLFITNKPFDLEFADPSFLGDLIKKQ